MRRSEAVAGGGGWDDDDDPVCPYPFPNGHFSGGIEGPSCSSSQKCSANCLRAKEQKLKAKRKERKRRIIDPYIAAAAAPLSAIVPAKVSQQVSQSLFLVGCQLFDDWTLYLNYSLFFSTSSSSSSCSSSGSGDRVGRVLFWMSTD